MTPGVGFAAVALTPRGSMRRDVARGQSTTASRCSTTTNLCHQRDLTDPTLAGCNVTSCSKPFFFADFE